MNILSEIHSRVSRLNKPGSLLIVRNDHLGDLVLTLPLIKQVSQWLGRDSIHVLINPMFKPLLGHIFPGLNIVADPGGSFRQLAATMKDSGADTVICAASKTRNAWAAQWSGIPQRLGFGYNTNFIWYTHPLFVHRKNPPRHEAEFCLDYFRKFESVDVQQATLPEYQPPTTSQAPVREILSSLGLSDDSFIIVHPGHSQSAEHFSRSQYRQVLERLKSETAVLLTGEGTEELKVLNELQDGLDHIHVLPSELNVVEFSELLRRAKLMVGGSSGPIHLASLVKTPRVGIYSNDPRYEPAKWKPLGDNQVIVTPEVNNSLKDLPPRVVSNRINQFSTSSS